MKSKKYLMTRSHFMIDTVSLRIKYPDFQVKDPFMFYPPLNVQNTSDIPPKFTGRHLFKEFIQNPTQEDKFSGRNKPRLTIRRRYENEELTHYLYVEFSIPKLLFGENLKELSDSYFPEVVSRLKIVLEEMSVYVSEETIRTATVNVLHFGKNILLEYPMTVTDVLNELRKADVGERMEVNQREYRNGGESLYFYTTPHNIIFYDKAKDMAKSKNISTDKNKTKQEKKLAQDMVGLYGQILRMEVRYTNPKIILKAVSKFLGKSLEKVTFEQVFNKDLCKTALIKNWEDIVERPSNQLAFKTTVSPEEILNVLIAKEMKKKASAHSLNSLLISYALQRLSSEIGIKAVRNKLLKNWSNKSCSLRLDQKIEQSAVLLEDVPFSEPISTVQKKLEEFKNYGS